MNVDLHCEELGKGPAVMILHGLFGSCRNWQGIARQLSSRYRLVMPDLRNHGNSPHASEMSYENMADDLMLLLESLNLGQISLIGHSMGGKAAMVFALKYPSYLHKLIIMDIAPTSYVRGFVDIIEAMIALPLQNIESRHQANEMLKKDITDSGVRTFLLQNLTRKADTFEWRVNLKAIKENLSLIGGFPGQQSEQTYPGETLFLGGSNSDYILTEHHATIYALFPESRIDTVPGAGHWLHADQPQLVVEHINQFLSNPSRG